MNRAEGFAPIPTWMIRDADVSIYALLVYAALSSRSGLREIVPGRETLAREARCSVRQVARALDELEVLGVVDRVRRKNSAGRASNGYTLHPNGRTQVEASQSLTSEVEDSSDGGRGLGRQGLGTEAASTPLLGRDSEAEIEEAETPQTAVDLIPSLSFDDFWAAWPRKVAKPDALRAWNKALKLVPAERICEAAIAYRDNPGIPEKQFIPHPATWLNRAGWDDELPTQSGRSSSPVGRVLENRDRGARLQAAWEAKQRGIAS